ncbi:ABC-three component system middle component 5 [Citreimonas salinaria]|uniref:ABC-three component system middle component 5 n=1 Tax=Citreimonas salinaria TaxID=321339 RepID=UPI001C432FC1|nr:ABC-three component system middle component 5 [Citreimonas salinaria]
MFSLAYTPAYDPYHTFFRFLVLLTASEGQSLGYRSIRAADFFFCFPWSLKDVRAPRDIEGFARKRNALLKKYPKSGYDNIPSSRLVFERMEMIQATAVSALAGAGMIDADSVASERLILNEERVPKQLKSSVRNASAKAPDLVEFLAVTLPKIDELGADGILARTGLGEYTYDVV